MLTFFHNRQQRQTTTTTGDKAGDTKSREVFKLHATSMAQNLPEIGRLPNFDIKMDKNVYENREPPSEIGRVGISAIDKPSFIILIQMLHYTYVPFDNALYLSTQDETISLNG